MEWTKKCGSCGYASACPLNSLSGYSAHTRINELVVIVSELSNRLNLLWYAPGAPGWTEARKVEQAWMEDEHRKPDEAEKEEDDRQHSGSGSLGWPAVVGRPQNTPADSPESIICAVPGLASGAPERADDGEGAIPVIQLLDPYETDVDSQ